MTSHRSQPSPRWPYAVIALLLLVQLWANLAWLRLVTYPFGSYHLLWSYSYAQTLRDGGLFAMLGNWFHASYYPPLNVSIWAVIEQFIGPSRAAAPIVNALLFLPGFLALYALARRATGGIAAGLIACGLTLAAPFVAFYMRVPLYEVPMGSMLAILLWGLVASERFTRAGPLLAAAAALGSGMLMKWTFAGYAAGPIAFAAADALHFGRHRRRSGSGPFITARQILLALAAAALAAAIAAPWYVFGLSWRDIAATAPADSTPGGLLTQLLLYPRHLYHRVLSPPIFIAFALSIPFLFVGGRKRESAALSACLLSGYAVFTLIPHKEARYAIVLAPICAAVVGVGLAKAGNLFGRKGTLAAACAGALLFLVGSANVYRMSFVKNVMPIDSGDLIEAPRECATEFERVYARIEPILDAIPKKAPAIAFHPFSTKTLAFQPDTLEYMLKRREAGGKTAAVCIGYENHDYRNLPERYPEADVFIVTRDVWDMSPEEVAKYIWDMTNYLDPGGTPPPVPEKDPVYRKLIESTHTLVEAIPVRCGKPILVYVRNEFVAGLSLGDAPGK